MKKTTLVTFIMLVAYQITFACEVCKNNQPKGLENITHGAGPTGTLDYIITWTAVVIVSVTLFYSVKYLVKPKENNPDHIKNSILNDEI
ncbi:hypothetical protein ACKGJN_07360 [Gillisia sp. Q332]|uniref:hypothetical protein n=1 Tax=Gillisia xinjiangensis TaxID=3384765 RepID=UPI00391C1F70